MSRTGNRAMLDLDASQLRAEICTRASFKGARAGRLGGGDPQPVDEALTNEVEDKRVGRFEDPGLRDAYPCELVDVEEPPMSAGHGVEVEERLP